MRKIHVQLRHVDIDLLHLEAARARHADGGFRRRAERAQRCQQQHQQRAAPEFMLSHGFLFSDRRVYHRVFLCRARSAMMALRRRFVWALAVLQGGGAGAGGGSSAGPPAVLVVLVGQRNAGHHGLVGPGAGARALVQNRLALLAQNRIGENCAGYLHFLVGSPGWAFGSVSKYPATASQRCSCAAHRRPCRGHHAVRRLVSGGGLAGASGFGSLPAGPRPPHPPCGPTNRAAARRRPPPNPLCGRSAARCWLA